MGRNYLKLEVTKPRDFYLFMCRLMLLFMLENAVMFETIFYIYL